MVMGPNVTVDTSAVRSRAAADVGSSRKMKRRMRLQEVEAWMSGAMVMMVVVQMLICYCICSTVGYVDASSLETRKSGSATIEGLQGRKLIAAACAATQSPGACTSSLYAEPSAKRVTESRQLIQVSMSMASAAVSQSIDLVDLLLERAELDSQSIAAARDCKELLSYATHWLQLSSLSNFSDENDSIQHWLSAALTYQTDCSEALAGLRTTNQFTTNLISHLHATSHLLSGTLSMLHAFLIYGPDPASWRPDNYTHVINSNWVTRGDNQLLQVSSPQLHPDVTVSQDGQSDFTKIQDAIDHAPINSEKRYIIYVKAGTYNEIIRILKGKTNLMIVGDGIDKTIISGSRSVDNQPGMTTFESATMAVSADQFLATDITVQNLAGPDGGQAVALRVDGDKIAFYRCSFEGFQDTLYAHALRQFYRECHITGTIDFIFGNAASVFQNCDIEVRLGRNNAIAFSTISAQAKSDPSQISGFVFQSCSINGTEEYMQALKVRSKGVHLAYLGRPWRPYSTTVFLTSFMEPMIDPQGWLPWNDNSQTSHVVYGEYLCAGPGYDFSKRVPWATNLNPTNVQVYTVKQFIGGDAWLPSTGFPYTPWA